MTPVSDNKVLDCKSDEYNAVFEEACEISKATRANPNRSTPTSYEGYCIAVDRVGAGLAEAAKKTLKDNGW